MANAQLRQECVDRSDLNPSAAACVSELSACDVVLSVGLNQRECREALNDLCACLRS